MPQAPVSPNEAERLRELRALHILDSGSEAVFDDLVSLASDMFDVPIALVSLVDENRQWFKACIGLDTAETPRSQAFCAYTILQDDVMVIEDAHLDPRVSDNPLVTGLPRIRFYAGAPLITRAGYHIGTFCLIDLSPRSFQTADRDRLRRFAAIVSRQIELRSAAHEVDDARLREEESRRLLADAVEALPDGFALYDRDDRLRLLNSAYRNDYRDSAPAIRLGASFEEILRYGLSTGQYPEATQHPGGPEGWLAERLAHHLNPSGPIEQQLPDGRWLRVWESRLPSGETVGLRVDVTWQNRLSQALKKLQQLSQSDRETDSERNQEFLAVATAASGLSTGMLLGPTGPDGTPVLAATDSLGLKVGDLVPPDHPATSNAAIVRAVRVDGRLAATLAMLANESGHQPLNVQQQIASVMAEWIGVEWGRRRVVEMLRTAKDSAELASEAKSRFLATMSHEIRTPMNGVLGMLGRVLRSDLNETQRTMVATARNSAESLLSILNDILDFSKLEAGQLSLEQTEFSPYDTADEVVRLFATQAGAKRIDLLTVLDPGVRSPHLGDPGRVRQILVNLVGNAVKFTERGSVTIRVGPVPDPQRAADWIRLQVDDTGVGIPAHKLDHLFDEFFQADTSISRRYGGTGLGLSICRRLTDLMGGTISAMSGPGRGSSFIVDLPLPAATGTASPAGRSSGDTAPLNGRHYLVVDADAARRDLVRQQLTLWGAACETASGPDRAYSLLEASAGSQADIDAVLLFDEATPAATLTAVADRLRRAPAPLRPKLILCAPLDTLGSTGTDEPNDVDCVLAVPFAPTELLTALRPNEDGREMDEPGPEDGRSDTTRPLSVLIVEDNLVNQDIVRWLLEEAGHTVTLACNGAEAVNSTSRQRFDLILMDIEMPVLDGFGAVDRMRRAGSTVPIYALTAHVVRSIRDQIDRAGFDGCLSKPIDARELHRVLERVAAAESGGARPVRTAPDPVPTSGPAPEDLPLWDKPRLDELASMLPTRALDDLLNRFLAGLEDQVEAIGAARSRPADCGELAHALKGSCRNLGATRLAEMLEAVEQTSRRSRGEVPEATIDDLRDVVRDTREVIRQRLAR